MMNNVFRQSRLILALGLALVLFGIESYGMEVGFAERDITPKIGMERPGGYGKAFHQKLHDACKVRAAVFGDGTSRVALVGLDTLFIRAPVVQAARRKIAERCGIPGESVMLGASHSHSAGPVGMILPGEYDHASSLVQELAYQKSSIADASFLTQVEEAIVDAVCEADQNRQVTQCGIGRGLAEGIVFNRRFLMRSGLTQTHPRQGNPEMVSPAGPIDPEVGVIGAWDTGGKLTGCVVNFACHCTTSPGGISADYVYYIEQAIRGMFGEHVVVVFLNGASGDVTQQDNLSPYKLPAGEQSSRLVGGTIGAEAIKVLVRMEPGELTPVASKQKILKIARRVPRAERVEECLEIVRADASSVEATQWTFAKELVLLDARIKREPIADVEVQAIQIGPAVFLANPAEYFCQFGLDMKARSAFQYTFPVSLANDCIGYVPTAEALGPHGGGYETRLTSYSNLIPEAGQQIADACIELSNQLQPGNSPVPPPALQYTGQQWTYGNVPPELD